MAFASDVLEDDDLLDRLKFSTTGLVIQMLIMAVPFVLALLGLTRMGRLAGVQHALLILVSLGMLFLAFKYVYFAYERVSYYYSFFIIGAFSNAITGLNHKQGEKNFVLPVQIIVVLLLVVLTLWRIPGDFDFFFLR